MLGLESAVEGGSISLVQNDRELDSYIGSDSFVKGEKLLSVIDQILVKNKFSLRDVTKILVSRGPGSYTGIRLALSTVLGLHSATGIECLGMTILEALSYAVGVPCLTAVPVGRGIVCCQSFDHGNFSEPMLFSEMEYRSEVSRVSHRTVLAHEQLFFIPDDSSIKMMNAGRNMALYLCKAWESVTATYVITPFFV